MWLVSSIGFAQTASNGVILLGGHSYIHIYYIHRLTCLCCESVDPILQPVEPVVIPRVMPATVPDAGGRDGARDERVAGTQPMPKHAYEKRVSEGRGGGSARRNKRKIRLHVLGWFGAGNISALSIMSYATVTSP